MGLGVGVRIGIMVSRRGLSQSQGSASGFSFGFGARVRRQGSAWHHGLKSGLSQSQGLLSGFGIGLGGWATGIGVRLGVEVRFSIMVWRWGLCLFWLGVWVRHLGLVSGSVLR